MPDASAVGGKRLPRTPRSAATPKSFSYIVSKYLKIFCGDLNILRRLSTVMVMEKSYVKMLRLEQRWQRLERVNNVQIDCIRL